MVNLLDQSVALVIGNGYDLDLGLNTRYSDFIDAIEKQKDDFAFNANEHLKNNELFLYLSKIEDENYKWIDAEYELGEYIKLCEKKISEHISQKQKKQAKEIIRKTKSDYFELKEYLKSYLMNIENNDERFQRKYYASSAYRLTKDLLNSDTKHFEVISFNYTNSFLSFSKLFDNNIEKKIKHVHGNLKTDIVFGIDDKTVISKDFVYILKSYDKNTLNINYNKLLNNSNKIIFFGYSLGESDQSYFSDFFTECCNYNERTEEEKREIIFYYKDVDGGYQNLFYRIKEITGHNTANFMKYNTVEFIDVNNYRSCFPESQKFNEMSVW
jgi:hypothetical protein